MLSKRMFGRSTTLQIGFGWMDISTLSAARWNIPTLGTSTGAIGQTPYFPDWIVLLIRPPHLWGGNVGFCQRNAASAGGANVIFDDSGFEAMYQPTVIGAYNNTYRRTDRFLSSCPTDNQAEVLVPDSI